MGFKFKFRHIFTLPKRNCHFHFESESILQECFLPKLISVYLFLKLSRFDRMNRANKKNALKLKSLVLFLCNKKVNNYKIVYQKCNFFQSVWFLMRIWDGSIIHDLERTDSATMEHIRSFTKLLSFLIFQNKKQTIFIFYKLKA